MEFMKAKLSGTDKAAILLLSLDTDIAARLIQALEDSEVQEISQAMANLGKIPSEVTEQIVIEFAHQMNETLAVIGNFTSTEKFLRKVLSDDKVNIIIEEIRGPIGKNVWDKLNKVQPRILANFLKNEHPQTAALIISKLQSFTAAKVLSILNSEFVSEILTRILSMETVKKEVLDNVEKTIRHHFIGDVSKINQNDNNYIIAEIFNNLDRSNEERMMSILEKQSHEVAGKVRKLMFTFDDLVKIESSGIQELIKILDKSQLALALKESSEAIRQLISANMSQRAYKLLLEEIDSLGEVKAKDIDEARSYIVRTAKDMIREGYVSLVEVEEEIV
ncbi:MAG: flagellar motor switch protein FliG [Candidatus Midichloria sp.]|uniref:Flagellar motor switch protein FliG n=1 Tax=Hyalomma marginatum TaxID=34627 RepID=A0A8S4C442_9ACAR|nr:flagellar motor switch protein FliG [Hyalomma marginatum]CAG7595063.1 flagellar motor switch protein FliG [Hyalomma marginatum]